MTASQQSPAYSVPLERLFSALDAAPIGPDEPILRTAGDKEHYETRVTFAVRKGQAARHHLANVERMLAASKAAAEKQMAARPPPNRDRRITAYSSSVRHSSHEFAHELAAFLAALRSGLDFVAWAAGKSLKGVTARSIHVLMNMVDKKKDGAALAVVVKHYAWLKQLKEYRDEVVHNLVVEAPASGWHVSHKGKTSRAVLPVVIPRETPKLAHDTRRSRMMDEEVPPGLTKRESFAEAIFEDGRKKVLAHEVSFHVAAGYVEIEKFMAEQMTAYDEFLADAFTALAESNFQQSKA